jgi:hypothetical protein
MFHKSSTSSKCFHQASALGGIQYKQFEHQKRQCYAKRPSIHQPLIPIHYNARAKPAAPTAKRFPKGKGAGVGAAQPFAPLEKADTSGPRALPLETARVVTALATPVALGTPPVPEAISMTLLSVELKFVEASEIWLLSRS